MKSRGAIRLFILAVTAAIALTLQACSRSAETYLERGNAQLEKGNEAAATLEFRNAVEKDPTLALARVKLAELYQKQGNLDGALSESVRAADLLPDDVEAQLRAGSLLLLAGRAEDAKARAEKALAIDARNADALVLRANALAGLKDLDGALEEIQEALSIDPSASRHSNLGAILAARGNSAEAEAAFRQAIVIDPGSVQAHLALAQYLWSAGRAGEAEASFKDALALEPDNVLANQAIAAFYVQSERAADAEPHLKKVADVTAAPEASLALADYYAGVKRPSDAISVLEALSGDHRYWALAQAKVADIQYAEGRKEEAFRTAGQVIAKHPALAAARIVRGRLLLADGRIDEALADAEEAVKSEPQNVLAHYLLGSVQEARRDLDAAARSYAEVLRLNPRAAAAQVRLAQIELQRNAVPSAVQLAEQAASQQPGNLAANLLLARALVARGDVERAGALTRSLVERWPDVALVHSQAGMLALASGDHLGARAAFEKALSLDDRLVEALAALVSLDLQEDAPDRARSRIERRLLAAPDSSPVLALAGRTWATTGDVAKGEEFLRRAIEADPSNLDAYSVLGSLLVSENRLDEAAAEFDKLAARQPGAIGPATMVGLILQAQGKEAEARQRYERLVEANPRAAVASNNLAWMYASRGEQLDQALQLAQAAKAELPDHPQVNDTLGFVYLKKGLASLAIPPFRLAVEKEPMEPVFHYHLGLAYAQVGDSSAARQELEQALGIRRDFNGSENAREMLKTIGPR